MAIAAVGQLCSTKSMSHNLEQSVKLVAKAAEAGAKVLFLPEASDYVGSNTQESLSLARPVASSPFVTGLQSAVARHSIAVHVGIHVPVTVKASAGPGANPLVTTIPLSESAEPSGPSTSGTITKLYNRTIWINEDGSLNEHHSYDKLHLFDYAHLRESASTQAGTSFTPPFPSAIGRIGSLICFDLRFPEAAVHLTQPPSSSKFAKTPAQILLYPSAFTVPTGRAHWITLLRARAIETQSWVVAAAQVGRHNQDSNRISYGRSLVVDPWGTVVLALKGVQDNMEAEEGAIGELGTVEVDLEQWDRVREKMPLLRRTDVYPEL